jgi:hypothetical protein
MVKNDDRSNQNKEFTRNFSYIFPTEIGMYLGLSENRAAPNPWVNPLFPYSVANGYTPCTAHWFIHTMPATLKDQP